MDARDKPQVTLITIVTSNRGFDSIFETLDSFYPQEGNVTFEFLVVQQKHQRREEVLRNRYPWVQVIQTNQQRPVPHQRNLALRHAQGEFLVFVDDHIVFPRNYLMNLLAGFSKGYEFIGGPIENANPQTLASWAHYFCEYFKWLPKAPHGMVTDLPGSNFACRATVLSEGGPFPEAGFGLETLLFEEFRRKGARLYSSPDLMIRHRHVEKISEFWPIAFNYGRSFAAQRNFPGWQRIMYALLSPGIAFVLYVRICNQARYERNYFKKFIQCSPLLLPTLLIRAAGEGLGYLFGKIESPHKCSDIPVSHGRTSSGETDRAGE